MPKEPKKSVTEDAEVVDQNEDAVLENDNVSEVRDDNSDAQNGTQEELSEEQKRIAELEAALEEAKNAEAAAKDSELRYRAEMENFKRRKEQDAISFKKYAAEKFIQSIIPILDSLEQASKQESDGADSHVVEGIRLIQKQLLDSLLKEGVTQIEALDQPFNPELHQAISQQKVDGKDSNVVVQEMQKGYKLHDRVVRPSMVVVSE